ncbi:MAG: glycosyltransferase family 4 protein [Verrucomicrobia bacterium]|nr:glycosyltransferase family 4 protein [Verrucomicrobiota bacterium]
MKLLIIDPNISLSSPSMKGVVRALPMLRRAGVEVELWCWHCDPDIKVDRMVRLPRIGAIRVLYTHAFGVLARLTNWWKFKITKAPRPDIIYSVAWYLPQCDVCHVHFSPWDWERRQQELGVHSLRDLIERVSSWFSLRNANRSLRSTTARRILCVSEAVAQDVRQISLRHAASLRVLPNSYDPARFHQGVRQLWRGEMRARLSYTDADKVFIFVSTGHYRRKGIFLAVESVGLLRQQHPEAKLLVVGGAESRLGALRKELSGSIAGWREFVTFTGNVPDVEKYFAAADAFLLPSYSEAFALVEVEADACGLPLFLTRHHGSEMILQEGVNGRFFEFDPVRMAAVLAEFVSGAWQPSTGQAPKKALTSDEYASALLEIFHSVCPGSIDSSTQPGQGIVMQHPEVSHS